jgi:hypothetical protein
MKIYFAGAETSRSRQSLDNGGAQNVLTTYYAYMKNHNKFNVDFSIYKNFNIFMDCGAYTAWTKGITINIHDYAKFLKRFSKLITVYPNLDVKGSVEKTELNLKILEDEGLTPLPVFHLNTRRWDILEKYIDKYEYIAVGAIAGEDTPQEELIRNLDTLFAMAKRAPITKFHGFGFTIERLLKKYPFYSVDSTSWLSGNRYGAALSKKPQEIMYIRKRKGDKALSYAVDHFLRMEKELTDLWELRGVQFNY